MIPPFRTFDALPKISVLTPTYGRTKRLPGLIQSFLGQAYAGPTELIILNDRHDQVLSLSPLGPSLLATRPVTIANEPAQYPTLGDKRNALLKLATGDFVCWWDDDDRYLPNHLDRTLRTIREGYRGALPSHIWLDDGGPLPILQRPWSPFANAIMERKAIWEAGGFPPRQMHQDVILAGTMIHNRVFHGEYSNGFPTCIYRKPGTSGHTHVGQFPDPNDDVAARAYMVGAVDQAINDGREPAGSILIKPCWERDYVTWCNDAWAVISHA